MQLHLVEEQLLACARMRPHRQGGLAQSQPGLGPLTAHPALG